MNKEEKIINLCIWRPFALTCRMLPESVILLMTEGNCLEILPCFQECYIFYLSQFHWSNSSWLTRSVYKVQAIIRLPVLTPSIKATQSLPQVLLWELECILNIPDTEWLKIIKWMNTLHGQLFFQNVTFPKSVLHKAINHTLQLLERSY